MKPVLLDASVCAEVLAFRPERLVEKFKESADALYISSVTAFDLYRAASGLPGDLASAAYAETDRFLSSFSWIETDFAVIRKAAMYELNLPHVTSHPTYLNLHLARAHGLIYVASREVSNDVPSKVPGLQIEFW